VVWPSLVLGGVEPVTGRGAGRGSRSRRRPAPGPAHQAWRWAEETAISQGLSPRVSDPGVLHEVAILLGAGREPDIRGEVGGARSELSRQSNEDSKESNFFGWWEEVEIWKRLGPVEVLRSDDRQGPLYGARCERCSVSFVVGWQRDVGAVCLAAVSHAKQTHGLGEDSARGSRSPEHADSVGVEGVTALERRSDREMVD
jgi:hypothetical protein